MQQVIFQDWGETPYDKSWDQQEKLFDQLVDAKIKNRDQGGIIESNPQHHLIFCEHPHVFTLGKSGSMQHLLADERILEKSKATFYKINRGGDITYHGPGQVVGYPILDLDHFFTDIHKYLRYLEEMIIKTLADYNIEAGRLDGATGVWLEPNTPRARKIAAMGVRCSRWVTMHGFAFNVNPDLSYFSHIIPCGINDKAVTSMEKELGQSIDIEEVKQKLKKYFSELFEVKLVTKYDEKEKVA